MNSRSLLVGLSMLTVFSCDCGTNIKRTFPRIEVLDDMGADRSTIDFGQVQLNTTSTARIRIRNAGTAALNISEATFSNMKFGNGEMLPVSISQNGELMYAFTFKPTEPDLREMGTVTLKTDDPNRGAVVITLLGTGIAAVATLTPRTLDFGEVYLNESKALGVTLTNAGTNDLEVTAASLTPATPPGLSGDVMQLKKRLSGGATAQTMLTFAPTVVGDLSATLDLTFADGLDPLRVTIRGKAIEAVPRVCFKFDDSPMESCTDRMNTNLQFPFGSLCDNRLFPPDGGRTCVTTDGGTVGANRSGRFYVRNEGNTPLSYALSINPLAGGRCDAGTGIDFEFSGLTNLDGGRVSLPTVRLPNLVSDPKPWETPPLNVTYRPTSRCRDDGADQVQIFWLRNGEPQGTNRLPQSAVILLTGQSLLPRGVPNDVNITLSGMVTSVAQNYNGLSNLGDAPLVIRTAQIWGPEFLSDGGTGSQPFEECIPGAFSSSCQLFFWATPPTLPTTLAGTASPSMPVSRILGQIGFGQRDGGTAPQVGTPYRAFAVFETDDPYGAACPYPSTGSCVVSALRAIAQ
jgi:hypothetical protein